MQEKSKNIIKQHIEEAINAISNEKTKNALEINPEIQNYIKEKDAMQIGDLLKEITEYYDELLPYIKKIKINVPQITDQTCICACYLLIAQVFKLWNSILLLGEKANNTAIMVIIRAIKEHNMLISMLALEYSEKNNENLKKWFSGDLIMHSAGRKKMSSLISNDEIFKSVDNQKIYDFETHLYSIESALAHPSYVSVLENINPFSKDFDFNSYAGFHRTVSALEYAKGTMDNTTIAIKTIFGFILKQKDIYIELNKILEKHKEYNISINDIINKINE